MKESEDMKCGTCTLGSLKTYRYAVILSEYRGRILLSRHRARTTWETQGGHIEVGETPLEAARRELYEESGAARFSLTPAFDYWADDGATHANGMVFTAEIETLAPLPESEMAEVALFERLPDALTYPEITRELFARAGLPRDCGAKACCTGGTSK